jgi:hypothetical protein
VRRASILLVIASTRVIIQASTLPVILSGAKNPRMYVFF